MDEKDKKCPGEGGIHSLLRFIQLFRVFSHTNFVTSPIPPLKKTIYALNIPSPSLPSFTCSFFLYTAVREHASKKLALLTEVSAKGGGAHPQKKISY